VNGWGRAIYASGGRASIWQLCVELFSGSGEAHRRGKSSVLAVRQLFWQDIDANLVFFEASDRQEDGPLAQEWNKFPEHGVSAMDVIGLQAERWMDCLAKLLPGGDDCFSGPSSTFGDRSAERSYVLFRR
jgi:hypothetical protein